MDEWKSFHRSAYCCSGEVVSPPIGQSDGAISTPMIKPFDSPSPIEVAAMGVAASPTSEMSSYGLSWFGGYFVYVCGGVSCEVTGK